MERVHEPEFTAEVQIGRWFRHTGRHGTATIDGGELTLTDAHGDLIAHAECRDIWAHPTRGAVKIWFDGQHYTLTTGTRIAAHLVDIARDEGAHVGKP